MSLTPSFAADAKLQWRELDVAHQEIVLDVLDRLTLNPPIQPSHGTVNFTLTNDGGSLPFDRWPDGYNPAVPKIPAFRLDSSLAGRNKWTLIPALSDFILRCDSDTLLTTLKSRDDDINSWANPLDALRWLDDFWRGTVPGAAIRWVGFISYDLGRLFEAVPSRAIDDLQLPLFAFALCALITNRRTGLSIPPTKHIAPVP